ncbi:MAG TPA: hypothetical protein VFQ35_05200, partial [Polyangiaceae bacterium]|nr:hypothetical protein [Polyangiaceae bacterium]
DADGETEPLLQPFEGVIWASLTDAGGANRFRWGFPAPGYVAWSSPEVDEGPEILKMARVDDPASKVTVATNVHYWRMSPDDSQWFWLSMADSKGNGLLQTAKFPDGEPFDLLSDVRDYGLDSKGALVAITVGGEVVSIPKPLSAPERKLSLDQDAKVLVAVGDEGDVAYGKHVVSGKVVDLFTAKLDGSRRCTLDTTTNVPLNSFRFGPGTEAAVWALQNNGQYDAYHTRLADCATESMAPAVSMLSWISRGTAMFVDEFDSWSASGSLRVRSVSKSGALEPAPATLLAQRVGSFGTTGSVLLYASSVEADTEGLYVRAFPR